MSLRRLPFRKALVLNTTRSGFKGLERRAVVLVVNEASAFERSRERLYVGLSRARDQLVVCGDPDFIREVGGPDLARRLNLAAAGFGAL